MPELILDDAAPLKAPKGAGRAVDLDPVAVDLAAVRAASVVPRIPLGGEPIPLRGEPGERYVIELKRACLCFGDTYNIRLNGWEKLAKVHLLDGNGSRVLTAQPAEVTSFLADRSFAATALELEFS